MKSPAELAPAEWARCIGARDTKLQRDVAIKILPEDLAHDTERLARFEREARTLASLNHPNIAQIHGLEESDGIKALVMELVEGPTLADRVAQGPIALDEALPIARQIAEALEAAHERGIIHRDLKPANVKVRPDDIVKVLDFGLAKALEPLFADGTDAAASPTITSPAMMTRIGVILGTAAYMSPEQAKGRAADKRSDVWAFGCVLYEMLTGRRAFEGEDVSDTLAAVLRGEPDWTVLPAKRATRHRRTAPRVSRQGSAAENWRPLDSPIHHRSRRRCDAGCRNAPWIKDAARRFDCCGCRGRNCDHGLRDVEAHEGAGAIAAARAVYDRAADG